MKEMTFKNEEERLLQAVIVCDMTRAARRCKRFDGPNASRLVAEMLKSS